LKEFKTGDAPAAAMEASKRAWEVNSVGDIDGMLRGTLNLLVFKIKVTF
jgi:hypothetical protein